MNIANYAILSRTKYESRGAASTALGTTQEGLVPMLHNDTPTKNSIPYGYCHCGCGQKTTVSPFTDGNRGRIKGEPLLFIRGHNSYLPPLPIEDDPETGACKVPLSSKKFPGLYALFDEDDAGVVSARRWHPIKGSGGTGRFYAVSRDVRMHNLLVDCPDGYVLDHINGNGLDNRRSNLRVSTTSENATNVQKPIATNSSGYIGVFHRPDRNRWAIRITKHEKNYQMSRFMCPIEAAIFRDVAALDLHGEFASLNFPQLTALIGPRKETTDE